MLLNNRKIKFLAVAIIVICMAACKTNNGAASVDTLVNTTAPVDTTNLQSSKVDSLNMMQKDSSGKDSIKH